MISVNLITAIGSMAFGALVATAILCIILAFIPSGRPFLGYAILSYEKDFVGVPERNLRAPASVRLIFLSCYLLFAAVSAAAYLQVETSVFQPTQTYAPSCLNNSCLA